MQGWINYREANDLPALPAQATILYRMGVEAAKRGDAETAVRLWRGAEELDSGALAPRLTLAGHFLGRDPSQGLMELSRILSLLRSHSLGDYNEGHTSESGFELGVKRSFHYALVPHAGDWREAGTYRDGLAFNHPMLVKKAALHAGSLPKRWVSTSGPITTITTRPTAQTCRTPS